MAATSEEKIAEKMRTAIREKDFHKVANIIVGRYGLLRVCHLAFTQPMIEKFMVNGPPQADNIDPGVAPELPEGANANALTLFKLQREVWEQRDNRYIANAENLNKIRDLITQGFDPTMEETIRGTDSDLAVVPVRTILTRLQTACNDMNPVKEAELKEKLKRPLGEKELVKEYDAEKKGAKRELARMGIEYDANATFDFWHNGILGPDKRTWVRHPMLQPIFMQTYHSREQKTAENLSTMLIRHEEQLGNNIVAGEMFAGAAMTSTTQMEDLTKRVESLEKKNEMLTKENEKLKSEKDSGGKKEHKEGERARGRKGNWKKKSREFFCSSHGWNANHISKECKYKKEGHRNEETPEERKIRLPEDRFNEK